MNECMIYHYPNRRDASETFKIVHCDSDKPLHFACRGLSVTPLVLAQVMNML
jgi:hypothetical protein